MTRPQGSYGIDAPYVPGIFLAAFVVGTVLGFLAPNGWIWFVWGLFFLACAALYLHTTYRGKFAVWDRLFDGLDLRGDERAVDVGCGRGAVTVQLASRLPRGHVDGVDLWKSMDQSGNDESHTRANLEANGVADRVDLHTADMRELPFPDGSLDVATASVSIHNLKAPADRRRAVADIYRVLKPGGRIVIADIRAVKEYRATLLELGAQDVATRSAGLAGWWGGPWVATTTLTATKAAPA